MLDKLQSETIRQSNSYDINRSYLLANSIFDVPKKKESELEKVNFTGNWANDDDVELFELQMYAAWLRDKSPNNKYRTNGDDVTDIFFKDMETSGINTIKIKRTMGLDPDSVKESSIINKTKHNKELEAKIVQRITKLNGDVKFKKLVKKAEKSINKSYEEYD
jgi:hypothetical protein